MKIPTFCPVCEGFMDDVKFWWDWNCCETCFYDLIENNEEKFKDDTGKVIPIEKMRELRLETIARRNASLQFHSKNS